MNNDLIQRMTIKDKMQMAEIAEELQSFIKDKGLEEEFVRKTGKGKRLDLTYEDLEEKCGLEPFAGWHAKRIAENQSDLYGKDCQGLRQTGRTTRMLLRAIISASSGKEVVVCVPSREIMKAIKEKLMDLLERSGESFYGDGDSFNVGKGVIVFFTQGSFFSFHNRIVYFDESFNDQ